MTTEARIAPCAGRAECFRRFVLEAPLNAVLLDLNGQIVAHSPAFETWLGYTRSFVGTRPSDNIAGGDEKFAELQMHLAAGEPAHITVRAVQVGDQTIWIKTHATYWHDDNGAVCGYLCLNQDVTAEQESELRRREAEILLQAVVENIPATVAVQDCDTSEYLLVNRKVAEVSQKNAEDMLGRTDGELFPLHMSRIGAMDEALDPLRGDGVQIFDLEAAEGAERPQSFRFKRVLFEDAHGRKRMLTVGEDITDLRRTARALEAAVAEANRANAAKSNFLANVSHEIRTPLNGVLGMAQVMVQESLPPAQQERLDVIRQCGETLLGLLNDLLDMSKIEAGKLELEALEFDFPSVIESACAAFRRAAEQKGLRFDLEFSGAIGSCRGDPTRLRQIVMNIVSNAVKFTDSGRIGVSCTRRGDDIHFEVADTGIGMTPKALDRLFEKFVQADASTTRRYGGTGLGLAISRDLVGLMGGTMSVASKLGEGSKFLFDVPLPRVACGPKAEVSKNGPSNKPGLRILVAEDNRMNRVVLEAFLDTAGYVAVFVDNGAAALTAWDKAGWDVILMDVQMPVMDGTEATKIIRRREGELGRPRTAIIALTANAMAHQADEYLAAGMDAVVVKPIDVKALLETIDRVTDVSGLPLALSA